jgi:hypothetical protein
MVLQRARQQNSESAGDSRENLTILKSNDSKIHYCRLGHNFMVILLRICPTLEVVRIFKGNSCIRVTENLEKFRKFLKNRCLSHNTRLSVMNSKTRLLNLLNFQGNSSGKRGVAAILRY